MSKITKDREVDGLKPKSKPYETTIGGVRGLQVRTYPSGTKTFEFRYVALNGKRKRLPLGNYPGLTLAKASNEARHWQVLVVNGGDPAAERETSKKLARSGNTLTDLAEEYFSASEKGLHGGKRRAKRPSTIKVERSRFNTKIKPALGERRIADIKRAEVKQFMHDLATCEKFSADYVASIGRTLSAILAFAVYEERLEINPVQGQTKPRATKSRERMFDKFALGSLWRALSQPIPIDMKRHPRKLGDGNNWMPVEPTVSLALRFALLTLTRRKDVCGASWSEIDLDGKTWTVPSERHKTRSAHVVPLSDESIKLLRSAAKLQYANLDGHERLVGFVFPSRTKPDRHVNADAITKALARTCIRLGIPHGSPHDFRRSGATLLTGEHIGIRRFIVGKILSHDAQEGSAVTEVYDRNEYLSEKRAGLDAWAKLLLEIAEVDPAPHYLEITLS